LEHLFKEDFLALTKTLKLKLVEIIYKLILRISPVSPFLKVIVKTTNAPIGPLP